MTTTVEALVVSVPVAAALLGIGRNHAYELCRTGQLPHLRLGKRIVIPKAAIKKLLDAGTTASGEGP